MERKLTKSASRMICGVCGGFAEYFNIDVNLVRIIFAALSICYGGGLALYIVCAILMPNPID